MSTKTGLLSVALASIAILMSAMPTNGYGESKTVQAAVSPSGLSKALRNAIYRTLVRDTGPVYRVGSDGCVTLSKQRLRGCFDAQGGHFSSKGGVKLGLRLVAYGRDGEFTPVGGVQPELKDNRVDYRHGGLTEWWRALPMGFEQGFTLAERPAGTGMLSFILSTNGEVTRDGNALAWGKLRYGKLAVTDANGKIVPATLREKGSHILIVVNDSAAAYPLTVDPLVWLVQEVSAGDAADSDNFGISVALDGDTALVGAPFNDVDGHYNQGAAYVFVKSNGAWVEQQELVSSDGAASDFFGDSVALNGNTALIGAPQVQVGSNIRQGAAYIFVNDNGTWTQSAELTSPDAAAYDTFGWEVALSGTTAMIGAPHNAFSGVRNPGAVYVFSDSSGSWTQMQKLAPVEGSTHDSFGSAIALAGTTALIGAEGTDVNSVFGRGMVYVYTESNGSWSQAQKLTASDGKQSDSFGWSVALSGSTALIGALAAGPEYYQGAAYIFTKSGDVWSQTQELTASDGARDDEFGYSVAIEGTKALIGAVEGGVHSQGKVYLFNNAGGNWTQERTFLASDGVASAAFGYALALEGNTALISAAYAHDSQGHAYFYGESDLALAVSAPGTVGRGETYVSQALATNHASAASPAVAVTVAVPAAASFVSATATQGSCNEASGVVTCNFGQINGNAGTATANVTVKATGSAGGTIENTASVTQATPSLTASAATVIVDNPPEAEDGTLTTYESVAASGTLVASDADGDSLTFSVVGNPAHGSVTLDNANTGAYTYTPDQGYSGLDSFTFRVSDGRAESNVAAVSITVQAAVPPVAGNLALTAYENEAIMGTLPASGPGGSALSFAIGTQPAHGTVSITDTATGAFTYTPDMDYSGPDSFTFTATDTVTGLASNTATVAITVNPTPPPNAVPPVAGNLALTTYENTAIAGALPAVVTPAADTLVFALAAQPAHGTVAITDTATGAFTYTPDTGYSGSDGFTFTAQDTVTGLTSNTATVTFTINATPPPNAVAPVASDLDLTGYENEAIAGVLPAVVTPAADTLVFALAAQPAHGTVAITDTATGAFTYTPDTGYSGSDGFTFTAQDTVTGLTSNTATVTLTINATPPPTPVAPVANDMELAAYENIAFTGRLPAAVTPASDVLSFVIGTQPTYGTVAITDTATGAFTYTPAHGYSGDDTFTFTAQDTVSGLTSNTATVHITIKATPPPNEVPPSASDLALATYENEVVTGTLPAVVTPSADTLVFALAAKPAHGTVSITNANTGAFTYTPASGYHGTDGFTFTAKDTVTGLVSNAATVRLIVNPTPPPNAVPPVASDLTLTTYTDAAIGGTLPAAVTPVGDPLAFKLVAKPAHGTLKLDAASGVFSYKPVAGYTGRDSFTFTVTDTATGLASNVATIIIHVHTSPKPPPSGNGGGGAWGSVGLLLLTVFAGLAALIRRRRGPKAESIRVHSRRP